VCLSISYTHSVLLSAGAFSCYRRCSGTQRYRQPRTLSLIATTKFLLRPPGICVQLIAELIFESVVIYKCLQQTSPTGIDLQSLSVQEQSNTLVLCMHREAPSCSKSLTASKEALASKKKCWIFQHHWIIILSGCTFFCPVLSSE